MSEKQELLRKKRDFKDQLVHLEEKYKEVSIRLSNNNANKAAAPSNPASKVNGQASKKNKK
jgi:hypothetical protein